MSDPTIVTAYTNTTPHSRAPAQFDCNAMWCLAQQFSTVRLCMHTGRLKGHLVDNYAVRARRIAATYARFYLEMEDGCDVTKKGRFYWMALGAFASKTVACTLEAWQIQSMSYTLTKEVNGVTVRFILLSRTIKESLGKGNLWLFNDISGWHWYYAKYPAHFDQCISSRNAANYLPPVQKQMNQLPWKAEALPKINNMQVSGYIREGFAKVKAFENETNPTRRPTIQLDHLLAIADHEQGVILQPLIYDDPDFAKWLGFQRMAWVKWASPNLELVFTHACTTDKAELKSVAPDDTVLERLGSRMTWIGDAAKQFHGLMQKYPVFMENEIRTIAGWVDMPDK
jgi:hypothetical protein